MTDGLGPHVVGGFLEASVRHLRSAVGLDAVVALSNGAVAPHRTVAVSLAIHGDIEGVVTWVFPQPLALELVRQLLCDPNPPEETANDGATELANILTGRASEALADHGYRAEIGVPRIHVGPLPSGTRLRLITPHGVIDLVLALAPAASASPSPRPQAGP